MCGLFVLAWFAQKILKNSGDEQKTFQIIDFNFKVRQNVVSIYKEFIIKLGQDYGVLLPDSLPFIAELLEDSDSTVEEITHQIVKTIEDITGESMDQYL